MSSRGTIKAGTFGGRQFRQRQKATTATNIQREKTIKKKMKGKASSYKIKEGFGGDFQAPPTTEFRIAGINPGGATAGEGEYSDRLPKRFQRAGYGRERSSAAIRPGIIQKASAVPLQYPLGRGTATDGMSARARDIQATINTMPLMENLDFKRQQREEQQLEEFGDDAFDDDLDAEMDAAFAEMDDAEGGQEVEAPTAGEEVGEIGEEAPDYGTAGAGEGQAVDMPDWMAEGDAAQAGEYEEGFMGDDLDGLANDLIDMDVGGGADMPDDLDIDEMTAGLGSVRVAPRERPTRSLVDELDFRKKARQQRSNDLSVPAGELPPSQGQVQWDQRILNQDPEWQAKYGGTRPAQGARSGVLYRGLGPEPQEIKYPSDRFQRDRQGNIKYSGKTTMQGTRPPMLTDEAKAFEMGRTMDLRPGHIGKDVSANQPQLKDITRADKDGNFKNFEGGASSKKKPVMSADIKPRSRQMEEKVGGEVVPLQGPVRHPKTRQVLREMMPGDKVDKGRKNAEGKMVGGDKKDATYKKYKTGKNATGPPILEDKTFSSAGKKYLPEEKWGLEQKGMSRDETGATDLTRDKVGMQYNAPHRDPFEGSRIVGKEAGKRATRKREAETKRANFVKKEREKNPDWLPQGYGGGFNYGAGFADWDKDKKGADKSKHQALKSNDKDYQYDMSGVVMSGASGELDNPDISAEELEALRGYKPTPYDSSRLVPAFPGAKDIFAPANRMRQGRSQPPKSFTNPPMTNLQATSIPNPTDKIYRPEPVMTLTSGSEIELGMEAMALG